MNVQENKIRVLVTGGTLDKSYDQIQGRLTFGRSHIKTILAQAKCRADFVFQKVMLKDSLYFTDKDRKKILEACRQSPEKRILITHGTDTMVETAQVLGKAQLNKIIVLTGAMVPIEVTGSDANFNLGFAFAAVQLNEPGVYIAMNALLFDWQNVRKNKELGIFETNPDQ
jgi:L-asparaginase